MIFAVKQLRWPGVSDSEEGNCFHDNQHLLFSGDIYHIVVHLVVLALCRYNSKDFSPRRGQKPEARSTLHMFISHLLSLVFHLEKIGN